MLYLVLGLVIFIGIHSIRIVAPGWREKTIVSVGKSLWKATYSITSLASFVLLIFGYSVAKPEAGQVYTPFSEMYHVVILLMAIALILMVASNLGPGYIKQKTKHPFLLAIILWSISHLWMNGDSASLLLFGSFLLWAIIDLGSALQRPNTDKPAPIFGNDIIAVVVGLGLYGLFLWILHKVLFGVALV